MKTAPQFIKVEICLKVSLIRAVYYTLRKIDICRLGLAIINMLGIRKKCLQSKKDQILLENERQLFEKMLK